MGGSNEEWGGLNTDETRDAWDSFQPLPPEGSSAVLDSFCRRKNIHVADLVRVGARLSGPTVLAFAFPGGLKFRNMVTDERWNYVGSDFHELKIIHGSTNTGDASTSVIVCEGETDAARLSGHYSSDVAVLPVGATTLKPRYVEQLLAYDTVYVATDADAAGDKGAEGILRALAESQTRAVRFRPDAGDWCDMDTLPDLPPDPPKPTPVLVPAGQLLSMDVPEYPSYFDQAILPVGGALILHGPYKSFKSWIALDLLAAIAQGEEWAYFDSTFEADRVAVLNFEIPWAYYRERILALRNGAKDATLFDQNFYTYEPVTRPHLVAGNDASESKVLRNLTEAGVGVALIDPVRRAMGLADLNAENEVRKILRFTERLNREGISVVLVHHDNKAGSKHGGGDPDNMTGSGAFAGDVDTIVSVTLPAGVERDTGTQRNMKFLLRNAPSPPPRGFELKGNPGIVYTREAFIESHDGDEQF